MTSIAILGGTGQQGRGLAQRFASAGIRVIVGSRDPHRARETVATWGDHCESIEVADNIAAVKHNDVIVLAVPFTSVDALLAEVHGHFKDGGTVIDVTVPVTFTGGKMSMLEVAEGSASEHIRARLAGHVHLAGTFKTVPAHLLAATGEPLDCDEFVCADSDEARAHATALVSRLPGLRPVDVGPITRARFIEHLTAMAIAINRKHKIHDARFRVVGLP
jgi:8-hydroxy-5-deazaflavin:NADPH oxidoreductase